MLFAMATISECSFRVIPRYLLNIRVQLEYLPLPLHLSDADLAAELRHRQAASLQAEGAV